MSAAAFEQCAEVYADGTRCTRELGHPGRHWLPAKHECHAVGCNVEVPPAMLMCRRHWYMVPKPLRDRVWATYRSGQEKTKDPSDGYMVAHHLAVAAVAEREGKHAEAEQHREAARGYRVAANG